MRGGAGRGRGLTVTVRGARRKDPSSVRWLSRQLNDPYVRAAQAAGYRSRAAFKLIELDDRFKLLRKGARVLDLGAAPGGWTQVAVQRTGPGVVAVDILPIEPIAGAAVLTGDLTDPAVAEAAVEALGGKADVVLSDMAPNTTGHAATDHLRIMALAEVAMDVAFQVLAPGGAFVCKVFQGEDEPALRARVKERFARVKALKPDGTRNQSVEHFLIGTGYTRAPRD